MLDVFVPPSENINLQYLFLDLNGTIAFDKKLIPGVAERLEILARKLAIYVITADTFGQAKSILKDLPVTLLIIPEGNQGKAKAEAILKAGPESCVSIGNGYNDRLMLAKSALSVAVTGGEGLSVHALGAARICVANILDALDLLIYPGRITATLRD